MFMKRTLSIIIVAIMILALLCACTQVNETSKEVSVNTDISDENSSNETSGYISELPDDLKFDGEEFIILSGYTGQWTDATMVYFGGDPAEGDFESNVVNDASILRNNIVEDMLDIDIVERMHRDTSAGGGSNSSFYTTVVDAHNSGTSDFHMMQGSLYNMGFLTTAGCLTDLMSLEHLKGMKGEWWNQTFIEDISIKGSAYYAVGDISFGHINCIYLIYFNKKVQTDNDLPDFYDLVDNNQWTYDKMFELSKTIKSDLNDDAKYTHEDEIGLVGQSSIMWAITYALNAKIVSKDAQGLPILNINSQDSITKLSSVLEDITVDGNYIIVDGSTTTVAQGFDMFIQDRNLFTADHTGSITNLTGQMTSDFGFLPHPKYDENQDQHYSLISPWGGLAIAVPFTIDSSDEEFVSAVMEEMAVQGKNHLTEAYTEKLCKLQKTTDDRSKDMLDIVFQSAGCDLGMIHKIGAYDSSVTSFLNSKITNIASQIQSKEENAKGDIDKLISSVENMQ